MVLTLLHVGEGLSIREIKVIGARPLFLGELLWVTISVLCFYVVLNFLQVCYAFINLPFSRRLGARDTNGKLTGVLPCLGEFSLVKSWEGLTMTSDPQL